MSAAFDDAACIRAMLAFEAALAEAEAEAGIVPADAARAIVEACESFSADVPALAAASRQQPTPAIPLVKALTAYCPEPGRGWVHWGATSQDVMDTGLVLQMRDAIPLLEADLIGLGDALAARAAEHRDDVMAGRTLLQAALPITFGFKCAGWLDAVIGCRDALPRAARETLVLQFGGAVGTLAALGEAADEVRRTLGQRLGLPVPEIAWHASRGRLVRLCSELAILCGALAKIAGDVALLMQPEIGEASEPAPGGSSTMPHKRNPVAAPAVRANALRAGGLVAALVPAMAQEHERGVGGWQAEWTIVPELFEIAAGSLAHVRTTIEGMETDVVRMRANLEVGGGAMMAESLMMALAPHIGRGRAHQLVGELADTAAAAGRPFLEAALEDGRVTASLDRQSIERALASGGYLGLAGPAVDAVIARWHDVRQPQGGTDADH